MISAQYVKREFFALSFRSEKESKAPTLSYEELAYGEMTPWRFEESHRGAYCPSDIVADASVNTVCGNSRADAMVQSRSIIRR